MFNIECGAQSVKLTLKFRAVVRPDLRRVSKNLENLLFYGISNRFTAFVLNQG
jgi:hypothetical protein